MPRHRGWTLKIDPTARLTWPVYPFDPYRNAPEKDIRRAVGALTVKPPAASTLPWRTQEISLILEVREPPSKRPEK